MTRDEILILSRSEAATEGVRNLLGEAHDLAVKTHVIDPRESDPLRGVQARHQLRFFAGFLDGFCRRLYIDNNTVTNPHVIRLTQS